MKKIIWATWILVTLSIAGYYGYILLKADNKQALLIGETSHGHFQIELACSSCHTEAFGGPELIQEACVGCHGAELAEANDTHPKRSLPTRAMQTGSVWLMPATVSAVTPSTAKKLQPRWE